MPTIEDHCPSPVQAFDYKAIRDWLRRNCWQNGTPSGECGHSARFVQLIFGWPSRQNGYHAWNRAPNGLVLDLTVGQFGKKYSHSTHLVTETTEWDQIPRGSHSTQRLTYRNEETGPLTWKTNGGNWVKELDRRLRNGTLVGNKFGISRHRLLIRVRNVIKKMV